MWSIQEVQANDTARSNPRDSKTASYKRGNPPRTSAHSGSLGDLLPRSQSGEPLVEGSESGVRCGPFHQVASRLGVAVDAALRPLMPAYIEGRELREKLQLTVRQVVVNPVRQGPPILARFITIGEPRNNDARSGAFATLRIETIPYMPSEILFVGRAGVTFLVTERIDSKRAVSGADGDSTKSRVERL